MSQKNEPAAKSGHKSSTTLYTVTPLYSSTPKTERLEDKIRRLILNDGTQKNNTP